MWLFLASECLFFGSLIAAYLLYRDKSVTGPYPEDLFDIPFTSVSAFILLMSSVTMVLALAAIQRGDQHGLRIWLFTTAFMGILFVSGQAFEFTGFHGAHVTVGVLILLSLFVMAQRGRLTQAESLHVELAGLYWHFVDIVWIVIFTLVYLIQPLRAEEQR